MSAYFGSVSATQIPELDMLGILSVCPDKTS